MSSSNLWEALFAIKNKLICVCSIAVIWSGARPTTDFQRRRTATRGHSPGMERPGLAPGDQHGGIGVLDQLMEILYLLEGGDLGVG